MDDWQPCFSAPGLVEEAVKNISVYFSNNPGVISYSLGVNHSFKFCECDKCSTGKTNYAGKEFHSDKYFKWANAVVEGVLEQYPDKWFGCLSTYSVEAPPALVQVHPRIIPYMTGDRMVWIDDELEYQGKELTKQWERKTSQLGWYDYIYGSPYLVPRIYFRQLAEYYKYGYENGVQTMQAEAYPNWGEGPKLYLASKLLWNPYLDVDALLEDWYVAAVGSTAAPLLKAFYEHWEHFWTVRIMNSNWFHTYKRSLYLKYKCPDYLDIANYEDITKSREWLEAVVQAAETDKQKARARLLLKAFEYYEASVISYLGLIKGDLLPGKSIAYYNAMHSKRYELLNNFEEDSVLVHPIRFDSLNLELLQFISIAAPLNVSISN
jgi:hypothetical protein